MRLGAGVLSSLTTTTGVSTPPLRPLSGEVVGTGSGVAWRTGWAPRLGESTEGGPTSRLGLGIRASRPQAAGRSPETASVGAWSKGRCARRGLRQVTGDPAHPVGPPRDRRPRSGRPSPSRSPPRISARQRTREGAVVHLDHLWHRRVPARWKTPHDQPRRSSRVAWTPSFRNRRDRATWFTRRRGRRGSPPSRGAPQVVDRLGGRRAPLAGRGTARTRRSPRSTGSAGSALRELLAASASTMELAGSSSPDVASASAARARRASCASSDASASSIRWCSRSIRPASALSRHTTSARTAMIRISQTVHHQVGLRCVGLSPRRRSSPRAPSALPSATSSGSSRPRPRAVGEAGPRTGRTGRPHLLAARRHAVVDGSTRLATVAQSYCAERARPGRSQRARGAGDRRAGR